MSFTVFPEMTCTEFDVRLTYRDLNNATGNLEVCFQNSWRSLGAGALNLEARAVACRSLGFTEFEGSGFPILEFPSPVVSLTQRSSLSITCGNETSLQNCLSIINGTAPPDLRPDLRVACLGELVTMQ